LVIQQQLEVRAIFKLLCKQTNKKVCSKTELLWQASLTPSLPPNFGTTAAACNYPAPPRSETEEECKNNQQTNQATPRRLLRATPAGALKSEPLLLI
jgi:hypothetical protein